MLDELSERTKNLISRGTMLLLGLVLLVGSWELFRVAWYLHNDAVERQENAGMTSGRHTDGGSYMLFVAAILFLPGMFFFIAAIVPTQLLGRLFPPPIPRTGDRTGGDESIMRHLL